MLFDHTGCMRKYETVMDILREFFDLRLRYYGLRKDWMLGMLTAEASKLSNQARFILEKIEGVIVIGKRMAIQAVLNLICQGPFSKAFPLIFFFFSQKTSPRKNSYRCWSNEDMTLTQ